MIDVKKLEELKSKTQQYDVLKAQLDAKKLVFDAENKSLSDEIKQLSSVIDSIKESIKPEALEEFKNSNKKKLTGGVGIRQSDEIKYDETEAFNWAKSKELFIMLDKKAFENSAPSLNLPFVKIDKKTTITFPSVIDI